jgi:outer membrane protein assembly factor BamB
VGGCHSDGKWCFRNGSHVSPDRDTCSSKADPASCCLYPAGTLWVHEPDDNTDYLSVPFSTLSADGQTVLMESKQKAGFSGGGSTGYTSGLSSADGSVKWESRGVVGTQTSQTPSADGQIVFVGYSSSNQCGYEGNLIALYVVNGSTLWHFHCSNGLQSAPTYSADGQTLFVSSGSTNCRNNQQSYLYALATADGSLKWKSEINATVSSPTLSADGWTVFAGSENGDVCAFATTDGSLQWKHKTDGNVMFRPTISADAQTVFVWSNVPSIGGYLYALNAAYGSLTWKYKTDASVTSSPMLSADCGSIFVSSSQGDFDAVSTADGKLKWTLNTGQSSRAPSFSADGGTAFVMSLNNVSALDTVHGTVKWRHGSVSSMTPTISFDGSTVFAAARNGTLYAFAADDGTLKWKHATGGLAYSSPIPSISSDKQAVYVQLTFFRVGGYFNYLFAIRVTSPHA